jgi:hypothetical protein
MQQGKHGINIDQLTIIMKGGDTFCIGLKKISQTLQPIPQIIAKKVLNIPLV